MLSHEGRLFMEMKPALALWPGLCLTVVVYGVNMFGDAMRDLLDPRLRGAGALKFGQWRSSLRAGLRVLERLPHQLVQNPHVHVR